MRQTFINFGFVLGYLFQLFLELLFSSDIPVVITQGELLFFFGYSLLFYLLFFRLYGKLPPEQLKLPLILSILFGLVWVFSARSAFQLQDPPLFLVMMNSVGLLMAVIFLLYLGLCMKKNTKA